MSDKAREIATEILDLCGVNITDTKTRDCVLKIVESQQREIASKDAEIDRLREEFERLIMFACHAPRCAASKAAKKSELAECDCGLDKLIITARGV